MPLSPSLDPDTASISAAPMEPGSDAGRRVDMTPPLIPRSVILPRPKPLPPADPKSRPTLGLAIEHSPRRIAFHAALEDFLEVLVDEATGAAEVVTPHAERTHAERARSHYEGMFRVTLHGLLLAADQRACGAFLLDNARAVADILPKLIGERTGKKPRRVLASPEIYSVARSYASQIWHWAGEVAGEVARESVEAEVAVFPHLLTVMRDNVLVFCRRTPPEFKDLDGYVQSLWGLPGRKLVKAMQEAEDRLRSLWLEVPEWLQAQLGVDDSQAGDLSARWPGLMLRFAESKDEAAPDSHQAAVWEELLQRLRQHALLVEIGDQIVVVERKDGRWREVNAEAGRQFGADLYPMTLFQAQGTGSTVERFGLRYDITNFSTTMAGLELMPSSEREAALRRFFFFQRRVQNAARRHGLHLEKYFGDGVLFSSTHSARGVLAAAVEIQRAYRQAVDRGMVFAGGIRLAANWGAYRMVAQVGDSDGRPSGSPEGQLFGPGIVEISRLVAGKVNRDLSEIKKLLTGSGYRREEVQRFFARFEQRHIRLVDDATESRRFWAYVNPNGTLVNEGIVTTASFLGRLLGTVDGFVGRHREGGREFLLFNLADRRETPLVAGVTHRGFAEFKGLAPIEVFEVVDAQEWGEEVDHSASEVEPIDERVPSWLPEPIYD